MPVNITMEFVQQLMEQNTALPKQNAVLTDQVDELTATVRERCFLPVHLYQSD